MQPRPPRPLGSPNPRPSPNEVRAWLADALTDAALERYLTTLRADPNWLLVLRTCRRPRPTCTLRLLYFPSGEHLHLVLRDDGALWHPESAERGDPPSTVDAQLKPG